MCDEIHCPSSDCWQRLSSGEERDEGICAVHVNAVLDLFCELKTHINLCTVTAKPEAKSILTDMLKWIEQRENRNENS